MADDGLFINFAPAESAVKYQPKLKGGSWRDRARAKKVQQFYKKKSATGSNATAVNGKAASHDRLVQLSGQGEEDYVDPRATKRPRQEGEFAPAAESRPVSFARSDRQTQAKSQISTKPREVVSSLFSYNPKTSSAAVQSEPPKDEAPPQPSNAPLADAIDTFTSLGLSAPLATYLLTKMDLKNPTGIQKSAVTQLLKEDSDAFLQSETGSGKTLAYLLPLVQRIMALSGSQRESVASTNGADGVHRDSGLFAIVLAPTRELCKQIAVVLEKLLGCAHWIVAGTVIGGEKKKSEKARLRKGLNILVATPGRLADHLENTKVLDTSNVRWLVLDEGDRLMDLGFEEEIQKIVHKLGERQKESDLSGLPGRRTTILCSATMKMNVQRLGEISLRDAVLIKGDRSDGIEDSALIPKETAFSAPAQLKQSFIVAAAKLRLVTLTSLLKHTFARKGSVMKAIVFLSCADSVDFHFEAFSRKIVSPGTPDSDKDASEVTQPAVGEQEPMRPSPMLSSTKNTLTLYKLHGSLPQATRTAIVKAFSAASSPSLLLATDVASRGLDLPNLDLVIEYDPPFSSDDHLHRIGRTARLGRDGRAVIFLLPGSEEGYVDVLKSSYKSCSEGSRSVTHTSADDVLKRGFGATSGVVKTGGGGHEWEQKATEFQLEVERWVLASPKNSEMGIRAFQSHVRAYATHVAAERKWFDIKELHLGHLAKAFGLREQPGRMNLPGMGKRGVAPGKEPRNRKIEESGPIVSEGKQMTGRPGEDDEAAKKMRDRVRKQKMVGHGADEFNIA